MVSEPMNKMASRRSDTIIHCGYKLNTRTWRTLNLHQLHIRDDDQALVLSYFYVYEVREILKGSYPNSHSSK